MKSLLTILVISLGLYAFVVKQGSIFDSYRTPASYKFDHSLDQSLISPKTEIKFKNTLPQTTRKKIKPEINYTSINNFVDASLNKHFSDLIPFIGSNCPENFEGNAFYEEEISRINLSCQGKEVDINYYEKFRTYQEYLNGRIVEYQGSLEAAEPIRMRFIDPSHFDEISLMINGVVIYSMKFQENLITESFKNDEHIKTLPEEMSLFSGFDGFQNRVDFLKQEKNKITSIVTGICELSGHEKTCSVAKDLKQLKFPL